MPRPLAALLLVSATLIPQPSHADRTYKVYKADSFGNRSILTEPEAVIEVDDFRGEAKVYEPNIFGEADTVKGPKYVIESDSFIGNGPHQSGFIEPNHSRTDHDDFDAECEEE